MEDAMFTKFMLGCPLRLVTTKTSYCTLCNDKCCKSTCFGWYVHKFDWPASVPKKRA